MQPVFVALLSATFLGEHPSRRQWLGILIAVAGAFVIAWGDWGRGRDALLGDALALGGAVLVSVYYVIGRRLRQRLDLWTYTGVVYSVAALALLLAALASGAELLHHPGREWLIFVALAALPTLLGHTGANYALAHYRAYVVNLALLGEPVIATLLAWGLPGIREAPPAQTVAGGLLILAGIALGVARRGASGHGSARGESA
jgi:drug/metabolite transporter (DMT)-like permease